MSQVIWEAQNEFQMIITIIREKKSALLLNANGLVFLKAEKMHFHCSQLC